MSKRAGSSKNTVLERLRASPEEHARSLARAIVSDALSTPISTLVRPESLAESFAAGLRATAESPELPSWLEERLSVSLDWAEERFDGTVEEHLGPEPAAALRRRAARPHRVDPALPRSVLRHRKVRGMLREGLQNLLISFGRSLTDALGGNARAGAFVGIMDMARSMMSMVRAELDRQLEGRVQEFVDDMLDKGVDKWTARLSTEEGAQRVAASRVAMTDVLLEQPVRHYLALPRTAGPAEIAEAAAEDIRLLAAWEGLEEELSAALSGALEPLENRTLEQLLEGGGLIESWRPEIESLMAAHLASLFASDPFGEWLSGLESPPSPAPAKGPKKRTTKKKTSGKQK